MGGLLFLCQLLFYARFILNNTFARSYFLNKRIVIPKQMHHKSVL
ncbi:hypothetical protein C8U37_108124 [Trichococcus patagoniensis]|uniref:Uncharacterized protein n=1 Tax=Trichococcus patagoniensis TaxID=382641 RepID=A0A2T5IL49_9LACT|nr:hypothetical protein C8U37_108124 [Trichococcus patagoniensis]